MKIYLSLLLLLVTPFIEGINLSVVKQVEIFEPTLNFDNDSIYKKSVFIQNNETYQPWVDSLYATLTLDQKIGQLFMVAAYSNKSESHYKNIQQLITDHQIGGLIFMQGSPKMQATLTNRYQSSSNIPLLIGIDAEWGLSMRLDSTYAYPWNMTLGAANNDDLLFEMGEQLAEQCKAMGIHFTFGPVVDVNTNPKNPIIGSRSFGEDKLNVTQKALAFMNGLQSKGVFATAKHFPGHGDTDKDSHYTLPTLSHNRDRMFNLEMHPYKTLINQGLASIMVAHMNIPSLEPTNELASTLSYEIVTNILQKQFNFQGLIITDALNMKGVSAYHKAGDLDLKAFLAGNDILLFPENVPLAIQKIKEAYLNNQVTEERLSQSVKKILKYKFLAGLNKKPVIDEINTLQDKLIYPAQEALSYRIYQSAITLLKNDSQILPLNNPNERIGLLKIGDGDMLDWESELKLYHNVQFFSDAVDLLNDKRPMFEKLIISYHKEDGPWKKHQISPSEIKIINQLAQKYKTILVSFAKPYAFLDMNQFDEVQAVLFAYQNNALAQKATAAVLFGKTSAQGVMPVTAHPVFPVNTSLTTSVRQIMGSNFPENKGINSIKLNEIDKIAQQAIQQNITPGMQILVARKGEVIYHKAFGHHTYQKNQPVKTDDVYDLASLTKILATLPKIMMLVNQQQISLEDKLGKLLPEFNGSNKENITLRDVLLHQARLKPWTPFYTKTLNKDKKPDEAYYRKKISDSFNIKVANNLYLRSDYQDSIMQTIIKSDLLPNKEYKYSDYGFIILRKIVEKHYNDKLDDLTNRFFYQKIRLYNTGFNAWQWKPMQQIVPSEKDNYFRHQLVQGYVHDMAAAMNGGVDGHAGLFSNALEVAKIMQVFLNKGTYDGFQFFTSNIMDEFNNCFACENGNRRGLGFDKVTNKSPGNTCGCTSPMSFGHTGFTGTMAWADPEKELIFVFLSNRTFPEAKTNQLAKQNIRENIQKIIYDAIID